MLEPLPPIIPLKNRRVWGDLAKILSTVLNPFLTALAFFAILAHTTGGGTFGFWRLLFVSTFFTSIGPMLYVFWLYGSDRVSDLDMSVRHERESVFGAFVIFYLLGTGCLWLMHAPRILTAAMAAYTISTIVVQYITRYWKISTHALGITAPLIALSILYGRQTLPFLILIPMVGWARYYVKAHTVAQIIAGALLGAVTTIVFFRLFGVPTVSPF